MPSFSQSQFLLSAGGLTAVYLFPVSPIFSTLPSINIWSREHCKSIGKTKMIGQREKGISSFTADGDKIRTWKIKLCSLSQMREFLKMVRVEKVFLTQNHKRKKNDKFENIELKHFGQSEKHHKQSQSTNYKGWGGGCWGWMDIWNSFCLGLYFFFGVRVEGKQVLAEKLFC